MDGEMVVCKPCRDCARVLFRGGVDGPWFCMDFDAWISEIRGCRYWRLRVTEKASKILKVDEYVGQKMTEGGLV